MAKPAKVQVYEIRKKTLKLIKMERQLGSLLQAKIKGLLSFSLFQIQDGKIGYSLCVVPSPNLRKSLTSAHKIICLKLN